MDKTGKWVLLSYRLPREPSTPRISVWRKFKSLGVVQLVDGVIALPHSRRNQEQLEWLAEEIMEAEGEAMIWIAQPSSASEERELINKMRKASVAEYRGIAKEARAARREPPASRRRTLARLRRELLKVRQRDYFSASEGDAARRVLEELTAVVAEEVAT